MHKLHGVKGTKHFYQKTEYTRQFDICLEHDPQVPFSQGTDAIPKIRHCKGFQLCQVGIHSGTPGTHGVRTTLERHSVDHMGFGVIQNIAQWSTRKAFPPSKRLETGPPTISPDLHYSYGATTPIAGSGNINGSVTTYLRSAGTVEDKLVCR